MPRHRPLVLACFLGLPLACAHAPLAPPPRQALGVGIEGSVAVEAAPRNAAAPTATSLRMAFGLTRLSACFRGENLSIDVEDLGNEASAALGTHFAVEVDGVALAPIVLRAGERRRVPVAMGLPGGPEAVHALRLTKRTEATVGEARFWGLADHGGLLAPPLPSSRRIWVLGDSISCGYGVLGAGPHCPFSPQTEDATLAYAGRLGRMLGASTTLIAASGHGIWQNLDGSRTGTVPQLLERALGDAPAHGASFRQPPPHAIVVNLGTNDALGRTPLDQHAFASAYLALLARLRKVAPEAHLFLALGPMLSNTSADHPMALRHVAWAINDAIAARAARGDRKVSLVGFTVQDGKLGYGCQYHPSLATQAQMATHLADTMAQALGWTQHPALGRPLPLP